jgi:deoxyribodipyrimidine photo-lyase
MVEQERIAHWNDAPPRGGRYVLYGCQASQRERYNHALEYAVELANDRGLPVVVGFGLMADYPEANARHFAFLLEGLAELAGALADRGVQLVVRPGRPDEVITDLAEEAAVVVLDCGYLRHQRQWREHIATHCAAPVIEVETDVVVPVELACDKEQYAARTIRPRIHRHRERFLRQLQREEVALDSLGLDLGGMDVSDPSAVLAGLDVDDAVPPVAGLHGGRSEALKHLQRFIDEALGEYDRRRNEPAGGFQSNMSPYLHFGQVSPVDVALRVRRAGGESPNVEAFLEELIVRRELSVNFVSFNDHYDRYECLPDWARATLQQHASDDRPYTYTPAQLEAGQTHDPYWNAAQREMVVTGKMHNYMRMYWGKKILEWTPDPADAFATTLHLNNKYELDGRDPNSYAGVAWCFGKHDRPWTERDIFGQVRYMNANGLERKFDMDAYLRKVETHADHVR